MQSLSATVRASLPDSPVPCLSVSLQREIEMYSQIHPTSDDVLKKAFEIASNAFDTQFVTLFGDEIELRPPNTSPSQQSLVTSSVEFAGQVSTVTFTICENQNQPYAIRAVISSDNSTLLRLLAETTAKLIEKEIELSRQDELLTEYATQISRDFEELVWTRELARHIQQTDIQNPLSELIDLIFPTLLDTLQASQLILIQHESSTQICDPVPSIRNGHIRSLGDSVISLPAIRQIISRYSERGRLQPVVVNKCTSMTIAGLKCFILVPIHAQGEEFGWILAVNRTCMTDFSLASTDPANFDLHDPEYGTFEAGLVQSAASFLASHAKNTELFQDRESLLFGIVRALINAIDAKDHYTCGHSDRVAAISRRLAQQMNLDEQKCEKIYLTGLLHDIGKIGVPDQILNKPNRLTDKEFEILKQHPVIGYRVLKHLTQISYVLPGVLHHHEFLNGNGYPDGLVGDQIPIEARIIAVADAFDAMTSDRHYRDGMPFEKAEEILRTNAGPQWDPNVLDSFFAANEDIRMICFRSSISSHSEQRKSDADLIATLIE